jgi:hypothetical protein
MRPKLPSDVEDLFPEDVVRRIYKYVPKITKQKKLSVSPQMQKDLKHIQMMKLRGKSGMYLKELEDFVLD